MSPLRLPACYKSARNILLFALFSHSSYVFAQRIDSIYVTTKNDVNIHCLIGFMGSGDYATALESMGATGYLHWLAIDFGVGLRAQDNIYLAPRLHWLVSRMKYESSGYSYNSYENSKFTSVLIPGLTGRYYFKNIGALYALASIGIIASVSSDFLDGEFTGNGIELECGLGYEFPIGSRCFVVELGYSRVPIKYSYQGYYQAAENSLRWGGMFLNIGTSFNITDY